MKTTQRISIAAIFIIFFALGIAIKAQTDTQTADDTLQPLAASDVATNSGPFFLMSDYLNNGGTLGGPYPFLKNTNAAVYSLNGSSFLVDDASITNDDDLANALELLVQPQDQFSERLMERSMAMGVPNPGDPGDTNSPGNFTNNSVFYSLSSFSTNGLWIEVPTNSLAIAGQLSFVLHNTIEDELYDILTTTNLALPLTNWTVEQSVLGSSGDFTPSQLAFNSRPNLFICARFGGSSDGSGLPDWWELQYFGTNGIDPFAQDPSGDGWSYLDDFNKGFVPGTWHTPPPPQNFSAQFDATGTNLVLKWQLGGGPVDHYEIDSGYTGDPIEIGEVNSGTFTFAYNNYDVLFKSPLRVVAVFPNGTDSSTDWKSPSLDRDAQIFRGPNTQYYLAVANIPQNLSKIEILGFDPSEEIDATNVTNVAVQLPSDIQSAIAVGNTIYIRLIDSNTNYSDYIFPTFAMYPEHQFGIATVVTNFANAAAQMKENLRFLLRSAGTLRPFGYSSGISYHSGTHDVFQEYPSLEDIQTPETFFARGPATTNYEYYGFHTFSPNLNFSFVDELRPVYENFLWRNFVHNPVDFSNGFSDTGIAFPGGFISGLFDNKYQYTGAGTEIPLPQAFNLSSSAWLFIEPFDINDITNAGVIPTGLELTPYVLGTQVTNIYGLTLQSAYGDADFISLGEALAPDLIYENYTPPDLQTVDYFFGSQTPFFNYVMFDTNAYPYGTPPPYSGPPPVMPGSPSFATTTTSPLLITGIGQPMTVSGWAKMAIANGNPNAFGYLEQYFDSTNSTGLLSPYGDFFPTMPGPATLVTLPDVDTGQRGTGVVNVIKLQLDVNHDGIMDLSFGGPDNTSSAHPFEFWINNDYDRSHDVDCTPIIGGNCDSEEDDLASAGSPGTVGGNTPDCDYQWSSGAFAIPCKRDLEDYTRLWLPGIKAIYEAHPNLSFELSIRNNDTDDGPAINLYLATESDGGTAYLTNTTMADEQISSPSAKSLGRLAPNSSVRLNDYFNLLLFSGTGAEKFIWCGARRGKGELVLQIKDGTNVLGETSAWIQLKDVKEMYERWTAGDAWNRPPLETATSAVEDLPQEVNPFQYSPPTSTNTPYILLVHGWNMQRWEKDRFAETAFKRLYWQGYQGRFGFFRWPTLNSFPVGEFSTQAVDPDNYDESEWAAWRSAATLRRLLMQLDIEYSGNVYLMAHSMGNVVSGEALRTNTPVVRTYIAMEAAVPSHCYDPSATLRTIPFLEDNQTPNRYAAYWTNGAPSYFDGVMGAETYVNFFNTNDYALSAWQLNQNLKPDVGLGYGYDFNTGQFLGDDLNTSLFFPQDTYQIFAFCDEARCFALGAQPDVAGAFSTSQQVELDVAPYNFGPEHKYHSGQFRSTNMQRWQFWNQSLIVMKLKEPQ